MIMDAKARPRRATIGDQYIVMTEEASGGVGGVSYSFWRLRAGSSFLDEGTIPIRTSVPAALHRGR
jgi:hypothetical protein